MNVDVLVFVGTTICALIGGILLFIIRKIDAIETAIDEIRDDYRERVEASNKLFQERHDKANDALRRAISEGTASLWVALKENQRDGQEFREKVLVAISSKPSTEDIEKAVRIALLGLTNKLEYRHGIGNED